MRGIGAAIGAALGLAAGAVWWWAWGCRVCAPGMEPLGPVLFSVVVGSVAGLWLAPTRGEDGRLS